MFVLHAGTAYGLDVTVGPGGDFPTDLTAAVTAVHDDGGGKITILDNSLYESNNRITDDNVDIVIEGDPADPPTLKAIYGCINDPGLPGCPGDPDDPATALPESTKVTALWHVQGSVWPRDPQYDIDNPTTPDGNPGLELDPSVPLVGGSVTFNGILFKSCFGDPIDDRLQCQIVEIATSGRLHAVEGYTVSFNDCIFEDREAFHPNANNNLIIAWASASDTTFNFDNCIMPWNGTGAGDCYASFLKGLRSFRDNSNGLDININQCTIVDTSIFSIYSNFIHSRKADTNITVTNSIIWPSRPKAFGGIFPEYSRFARAQDGNNAGACHEFFMPGPVDGDSSVANGGSGYVPGDLLTLVGGNQALLKPDGTDDCVNYGNPEAAIFEVTQVNGANGDPGPGPVTRVRWTGLNRRAGGDLCGGVASTTKVDGVYADAPDGRPANPVTTTSAAGSGATVDVVWERDLTGTLMTGTISNSVAKVVDPAGEFDFFAQTDVGGFIAIGASVVSQDPMLVRAEGIFMGENCAAYCDQPFSLMEGYALQAGSPAIGLGDMGQNVGWRPVAGPPPDGNFQLAGDCNQDGSVDLSDAVCLLGFLFQNNPAVLPCSTMAGNLELMDCNGDASIDLSDVIYKLAFLFQGGNAPVQGLGCVDMACPANPGCP
jgi:hypothetical protein